MLGMMAGGKGAFHHGVVLTVAGKKLRVRLSEFRLKLRVQLAGN